MTQPHALVYESIFIHPNRFITVGIFSSSFSLVYQVTLSYCRAYPLMPILFFSLFFMFIEKILRSGIQLLSRVTYRILEYWAQP